jgi:hypothetical protein
MSDGVVSIKTYKKKAATSESSNSGNSFVNTNRQPHPGTYRYFMRGKTHKPNPVYSNTLKFIIIIILLINYLFIILFCFIINEDQLMVISLMVLYS